MKEHPIAKLSRQGKPLKDFQDQEGILARQHKARAEQSVGVSHVIRRRGDEETHTFGFFVRSGEDN